MSTILVTYEFGAGLGHLNRLIAVAQRLQGDHNCVFALPDHALGEPIVRRAFGDKVRVLEGVQWPAPNDPNIRKIHTHTFADVITIFRYDDIEILRAKAARWHTILQEAAPDLIIADIAPTLRLAVGGKVPMIVVGNGYTVLPRGRVLPPIRPWEAAVPAASRAKEGRLLAAVNVVRARSRGEAVDFFSDLFSGEQTFVCTFPEFDPYRRFRCKPSLWPFNIPEIPLGRRAVQGIEPLVFVYLPANHPALSPVVSALNELDVPSQIYVSGMRAEELAKRCNRAIRIHRRPADLARLLPSCSVIVHHGGLGTAHAGLLGGVPQLVLPLNLEHNITSASLEEFGVATRRSAGAPVVAGEIRDMISSLLQDRQVQATAVDRARIIAARRVADPVNEVVQACRQYFSS